MVAGKAKKSAAKKTTAAGNRAGKDLSRYAESEPTSLATSYAEWLTSKTGYDVDVKTVDLAVKFRQTYQKSPENKERQTAERGSRQAGIEERKAAREATKKANAEKRAANKTTAKKTVSRGAIKKGTASKKSAAKASKATTSKKTSKSAPKSVEPAF